MKNSKQKLLSQIPQVDQTLKHANLKPFIEKLSHEFVLQNVQIATDECRAELVAKKSSSNSSREVMADQILSRTILGIQSFLRPGLQRALNGTGIILHTGSITIEGTSTLTPMSNGS